MPIRSTYAIPFAVPFTHRVAFTDDALGADEAALLDAMPPGAGGRALFVLDGGLLRGDSSLRDKLDDFLNRHAGRVERAGPDVIFAGGEACKNRPDEVDALLAAINAAELDRRCYVVVIGGGAVLDAAGYAAAVAHRGVRLVRLPSTTLAQADSGLGVKNAVNRFGKKNWQGTFAVPWAVVNDAALLKTLPDREYRAGFSEAVKVALLKEPAFFDRLCADAPRIAARDAGAGAFAIERSAHWHLMHITTGGDPFEALEARPLDFGHWAAHRLEPMTDFAFPHGEAVGTGVAIDSVYSALKLGLPRRDLARILACLRALGQPLAHPALARADELLGGLEEFRQHLGGRLTITLLRAVGEPVDVHEIDAGAMREAIDAVREGA